MESLKDFGECIITIQACVIKKFLQGFMAPKQKKKKKQAGEESGGASSSKAEEVDEEKKLAEEARVRKELPRVGPQPKRGVLKTIRGETARVKNKIKKTSAKTNVRVMNHVGKNGINSLGLDRFTVLAACRR